MAPRIYIKGARAPTGETLAAIARLSADNFTQSEIAARLGVTRAKVGQWQREHGIAHMNRTEARAHALRTREYPVPRRAKIRGDIHA